MATKNKPTVDNTVTYANSPTTNAAPIVVATAKDNGPRVIRVPLKLEDVQHQVGMFSDLPRGRYVMEYSHMGTTNVLSVYWDGIDTVSL